MCVPSAAPGVSPERAVPKVLLCSSLLRQKCRCVSSHCCVGSVTRASCAKSVTVCPLCCAGSVAVCLPSAAPGVSPESTHLSTPGAALWLRSMACPRPSVGRSLVSSGVPHATGAALVHGLWPAPDAATGQLQQQDPAAPCQPQWRDTAAAAVQALIRVEYTAESQRT